MTLFFYFQYLCQKKRKPIIFTFNNRDDNMCNLFKIDRLVLVLKKTFFSHQGHAYNNARPQSIWGIKAPLRVHQAPGGYEIFAERYKSCNIVIPRLDRGIQCFQGLSGFPRLWACRGRLIKSGMTEKGVFQRSRHMTIIIKEYEQHGTNYGGRLS
jgi:hypothetical protein